MPVSTTGNPVFTYALTAINIGGINTENGPMAQAIFTVTGGGLPANPPALAKVIFQSAQYAALLAAMQGNPTASPPVAPNPCAFAYNALGTQLGVTFTLPNDVENELA